MIGDKAEILMIEDDLGMRTTLSDILEDEGHKVTPCSKGQAALELLHKRSFDIVILDIKLPDITGDKLLESVKEMNPDAAVVMMTGYASVETAIDAMRQGAYAYLTKPINPEELKAILKKALRSIHLAVENKRLIDELQHSNRELERAQQASLNILRDLEKAKNYIENIVTSLSDSLMVTNRDGIIQMVNHFSLDFLGYHEEELIGKEIGMIFQEGKNFAQTILAEILNKGSLGNYETNYKKKNGKPIPVLFSGSVLKGLTGEPEGVVIIAKDISDLKEIQNRLVETQKLATVGQLAAGAAHELNNPLAGIIGFSEAILHDLKNKKLNITTFKNDIETILNNANRCKNIASGMLIYGKKIIFDLEPLDIHEVIEESIPSVRNQMDSRKIRIVKEYAQGIPKINGNKSQLYRIFINIIHNGFQAMKGKGQLTIGTQLSGDYVDITFKDTGIGIPEEDIKRIFDPFFTTKEVGEGVGLGLAICKGIIKAHKGEILVESEGQGKGTTFTVRLPIKPEEVE